MERHKNWICYWGYCIILSLLVSACNDVETISSEYSVSKDKTVQLYIEDWYVAGPFTLRHDSLGDVDMKDRTVPRMHKSDNKVKLWYDGLYHPKYGQLDLREVYGISISDTTRVLDSLATFMTCTIKSERERNLFLYVRTEMDTKEYVNNERVARMDYKDMNIYPVHLKSGENTLLVKTRGTHAGYWYEATLYDSVSMARLYAEQHTGNIIFPIVTQDTVSLTETHADLAVHPVRLLFQNVRGEKVSEVTIDKQKTKMPVPRLRRHHAYLCSMIMEGDTVRQPVLVGDIEETEDLLRSLRDSLPTGHPRSDEIDQLLYRIWKLNSFTGKMREDYWFPFKFPWVFYQLEHAFAHLDGTYGNDAGENNLKFITYRSRLDGCLQRYILVTPNKVDDSRKYPLVVVVRPNCEKFYHLFFCPQIAHQEVVNDMQAVANEYDTFVIMPEARMMLDEDFTPFIDAEMKLAIADAQEHFGIDEDRIFLHANCSGGYRALRFATSNPGMFAGIALYAPVYKRTDDGLFDTTRTPAALLSRLHDVPIFIYGDPVDTHSPYRLYADLVKDCRKYGIPCRLKLRRNTGEVYPGYHRYVVGRDACEFFRGRRRCHSSFRPKSALVADTMLVDFYAKPFIYVYNASDTSTVYRRLVKDIQEEYESYMYAKLPYENPIEGMPRMPLLPDTRVTNGMLETKNVFLIGERFTCPNVRDFARKVKSDGMFRLPDGISLSACRHPYNPDGMTLLYRSSDGSLFTHQIKYPWKTGFSRVMSTNKLR